MATFCLDCVVYNINGSLLENLTRAAAPAPAPALSLGSIAATVSSAHFYALPSLLTFGLVFSLFNAACLAKSCSSSSDCYLTALATQALGSTLLAVALHAPTYAETFSWYPRLVAIASGLHDWAGCAYTWTLLAMCAERRLTVKRMMGQRHQAYCGCVQAGLAALMVAIVTLVAALPQLWMKEVQASVLVVSSRANATVLRIGNSPAGLRPEYAILYQFFRDLSAVLIPAPVLAAIVCQLLCCSRSYNRQLDQLMMKPAPPPPEGDDDGAGSCSNDDRMLAPLHQRQQRHQRQVQANRMAITLGCCHLVLSFPLLALLLLWGHRPHWLPTEDFRPLYQLFSLLYYLYYPVAFLLHACFLADYRTRMRRLFCSESCHYTTYVVE